MEQRRVLWIGVAVLATSLLVGGFVTAHPSICGPGCTPIMSCTVCGASMCCVETGCSCSGTAIPGTPGAVVTVPAPLTPTPFPPLTVDMCLSDECPPGETRYTLVSYRCEAWCWPHRTTYLEGCCGPHCPCGEPTEEEQPCTPGSGGIGCLEYGAEVCADLPVWHANREPYPRALVTLPETVWVSDAAGNPITDLPSAETWSEPVDPGGSDCDCRDDDSCDDEPPPGGTVCEYRVGLKADPGNEPPTWIFEDCGSMTGWIAQCGWNRSSWGKPELGVGMAPDCPPLPAYTVGASVPYWWSFGRQWEQWEKVSEDCECVCHGGAGTNECVGEPGLCINAPHTEHWEHQCDPVYNWKHHGPDWVLLDLTDYGWPIPYMPNPNVKLIPHLPCEPNPPVGAIYVPCIEVQAPIEK